MIRITKAGWLYILLTIFLGFSAVNTGNNLIYLIVSALLGFMGISGLFGRRNITRVEARVEFPGEVYANRPVPVKVTLGNRKRFLPGFLLRVAIGDRTVLFPFVEAGAATSRYLTLSFGRRGLRREKVRVCSVFPFNFFIRCSPAEREAECIVFPEPKPCDLLIPSDHRRKFRGEETIGKAGYDEEVLTIREYLKGDPLKHISWKATAKTGALKTKEMSSQLHQPIIVDLDAIPLKDLEEKLSCAAYTVLQLMRRNFPVGLKIGGRLFKPGVSGIHKTTLLRELALHGTEE